ncbi:MAG: HAMP domain-containing sensor histidine kinase, partial [Acidimicrobiia bacterium]|nr:HAMP domain-containing sensor histidine kinase [Acidimicrobiia bacterium]
MTSDSSSRSSQAFRVRATTEELPFVLTDILIYGFGILVAIGVVEWIATGDLAALFQVVAVAGLLGWALLMKRSRAPRPIWLIVAAITLSFVYLLAASLDPSLADVRDTAPIAIIVGAGVIALALGGRESVAVGAYALVVTAAGTVVVQVAIGSEAVDVVVDAANSVVVMGIAFFVVRSIRRGLDVSAERYRGLVESSPVAVAEVDIAAFVRGDRRVLVGPMNQVASNVLGYPDGRRSAWVHRDSMGEFADVLETVAGAPSGTLVRTLADGRTFKIGWKTDPSSGTATLSGTDITAQRMVEEELSGQVSARDRFLATVSHELRTPLTGAMGLLDLVQSGEVDEDDQREMIGLALLQVRDMADIVEDLLVAGRAASGKLSVHPSSVDVSQSVKNVLAVIGEDFATDIEEALVAWADPVRVRQIVKNLVTNAIRYGGPDRRVVVATSGHMVKVEVIDDGPPLSRDFVERMFEPYERASARTDSVGLGLTVARTLARLM